MGTCTLIDIQQLIYLSLSDHVSMCVSLSCLHACKTVSSFQQGTSQGLGYVQVRAWFIDLPKKKKTCIFFDDMLWWWHCDSSLVPRPHPFTRKGVWWQLSIFLVVLSQQSCFCASNQIAGIRACILATLAIRMCARVCAHTPYGLRVMVRITKKTFKCHQTLLAAWGFGSGNETTVIVELGRSPKVVLAGIEWWKFDRPF